MKKTLYILFIYVVTMSFSFGAESYQDRGALDWYGYNSLLSTEAYVEDNSEGSEDKTYRKRRHRRRRKIRPPKKGW